MNHDTTKGLINLEISAFQRVSLLKNIHNVNISPLPERQIFYDFLVTVNAAPHECVIRTGQP